MAIKPKKAARPNAHKKTTYVQTSKRTFRQFLFDVFYVLLTTILSAILITIIVLAFVLIISFFASDSKDLSIVSADAILRFQSIRTGIFIAGILLMGTFLIGAILHKMRWIWAGVLLITLSLVTLISAGVDFILYGETSSSYVPAKIVDALYKESSVYRKNLNQ